MSKLHNRLAQAWLNIQDTLFPWLVEGLGELMCQHFYRQR